MTETFDEIFTDRPFRGSSRARVVEDEMVAIIESGLPDEDRHAMLFELGSTVIDKCLVVDMSRVQEILNQNSRRI